MGEQARGDLENLGWRVVTVWECGDGGDGDVHAIMRCVRLKQSWALKLLKWSLLGEKERVDLENLEWRVEMVGSMKW